VYDGVDEGRNWRGILLSLLVISLVIAGIVMAIHTLGYVDELLYLSGRRMTLNQLLGGELQPRRLSPAWVAPHHFVFHADDGSLALWSANTSAVTTLVTNHTMVRDIYFITIIMVRDIYYILLQNRSLIRYFLI
jgi:hypothetical protein